MNPKMMRWLDFWIGQPLCVLLSLWRRIWTTAIPKTRNRHGVPRRIVFIKLVEQGSTVLAYTAFRKAMKMVGQSNIFFCVLESNKAIVKLMGVFPESNILVIRDHNLAVFAWDTLRTLWAIRRLSIDAAVDMEFFSRFSAILAFLGGLKYRVGHHRFTSEAPYRGTLMTHPIQANPYLHTARVYALMVDALKSKNQNQFPLLKIPADIELETPRFSPRQSESDTVRRWVFGESQTAPQQTRRPPAVILNPNASDLVPIRKWPAPYFVELGKQLLLYNHELKVVITGAPGEIDAATDLHSKLASDRVVNLAGKTRLSELLTLFYEADVLITNDSGPAHFASMTPIHSVVLFGPETPHLYKAVSPNTSVIWRGLACSPCVNIFNHRLSPCSDPICMTSISPAIVFRHVVHHLETANSTHQKVDSQIHQH